MYSYVLFGILMFIGILTFFLLIIFCIIKSSNSKVLPEPIKEETNNLINEVPKLKHFTPSKPIPIPKPKKNIKYFHNDF